MPATYSNSFSHLSLSNQPNHFRIASALFLVLCISYVSPYKSDSPYIKSLNSYESRVLSAESSQAVDKKTEQVKEVAIEQAKATPMPRKTLGVSEQVDEHTWTITVTKDDHSATPAEIHEALNAYRQKNGVNQLVWDDTLASFAKERVISFTTSGSLDSHAGFKNFINNQEGFSKLGFNALGENSSYGFTLTGLRLIEEVYAGDKPHDDNQLNASWTHVGIGVQDTATNLIFGGKKR